MGVFVFAILIGDIRDIVSNARVNVLTYQKHLDAVTTYMNNNKVARRVQVSFTKFGFFLGKFAAAAQSGCGSEASTGDGDWEGGQVGELHPNWSLKQSFGATRLWQLRHLL